jgi:hypothetical protein
MRCEKCQFSQWNKILKELLCTFHSDRKYLCRKENYDGKCPYFKERNLIQTVINYIKK